MNTNLNECRAKNCELVPKLYFIFCLQHWRLVPSDIQRRISKFKKYGPETAYHQAVEEAINIINEEEEKRLLLGLKP